MVSGPTIYHKRSIYLNGRVETRLFQCTYDSHLQVNTSLFLFLFLNQHHTFVAIFIIYNILSYANEGNSQRGCFFLCFFIELKETMCFHDKRAYYRFDLCEIDLPRKRREKITIIYVCLIILLSLFFFSASFDFFLLFQ